MEVKDPHPPASLDDLRISMVTEETNNYGLPFSRFRHPQQVLLGAILNKHYNKYIRNMPKTKMIKIKAAQIEEKAASASFFYLFRVDTYKKAV